MATQTEDSATDATSPTPYSPQAGNQGLTLPPPSQGLPLGGPSGIQPPMRGPAGPPPLPQTPQPDFQAIQNAIAQQQRVANNPLAAFGAGLMGQNLQAPVLDQQMKLAQMIQQQRSSALQEQQMHQQSLDRNIDMMLKVRQGIETQQLPPEFADTIGPILEQQHNALFGEGSPYANQGLPAAPGSITEMLKKGSSGGVTIQNAIDAQKDATPEDMQAAILISKRDPKDGVQNAQKYLDSRRQARLKAVEPTLTDHLSQLVEQLRGQMGGGTPTLAQVTQAAQAELAGHSDTEIQQAYGESKDFVKKALVGALKSDSPFIKGLNVQVGPGEVKGMGDASQFMFNAIGQLQAKYPQLKGVTPSTIQQQPAEIQNEVGKLATTLSQQGKGQVAKLTGLGQVEAKQDEPLVYGDPKGHYVNKVTGAPINPVYTSFNQVKAAGPDAVARIEDGADWQSYTANQQTKKTIGDLIPYAEQLSRKPGGNWANALEYWYNEKSGGPQDPGLALKAYAVQQLGEIKAITGSSRITTSEQNLLAIMPKPTDSATRALEKLRIWNKMTDTINDIHLGKAQPSDITQQIADAQARVQEMNIQDAKAKLQPGERLVVGPDNTVNKLDKGMPLPKGYRYY